MTDQNNIVFLSIKIKFINDMNLPFIGNEVDIFYYLNSFHSPFWDAFMYIISFGAAWIPWFLFFIFFLCYKRDAKEAILVIIAILICILICDQLSSGISKPLFARLRPSRYPGIAENVNTVYSYLGGNYGFFSGHASNITAVVTLACLTFRDKIASIMMILVGGIVVYSRIYLGVHFVSDIVVGIIVGLFVGLFVNFIHQKLRSKICPPSFTSKISFAKTLYLFKWSIVIFIITLTAYSYQVATIVSKIS